MKCITQPESLLWIDRHGYEVPYARGFQHVRRFSSPVNTGRKTALARRVVAHLFGAECLVHVTSWSIWPSSENMGLFRLLRAALGEHRGLHDAPGHLFSADDSETIESLLDVVLYFFWDAFIMDGNHRWMMQTSHDEYIELACEEELREVVDDCVVDFEGR